ncbi:hypothetical protein V493_06525 [Pseudogymnoascus sp. VKM F-4281 (FW-2241)]|nr:hypothetical protein V493_06525 [Pseudogymnoascus sp. VKM F-4281 (FW-2241)]
MPPPKNPRLLPGPVLYESPMVWTPGACEYDGRISKQARAITPPGAELRKGITTVLASETVRDSTVLYARAAPLALSQSRLNPPMRAPKERTAPAAMDSLCSAGASVLPHTD